MDTQDTRRSAEHFLALIKASHRGKFKVYIGMSAGVGKGSRRPIDALIRPHDLHLFTLIWPRTRLLVAIAVHDIYIAIVFSGSVMTDGFYFIGSYGHCSSTS